MELPRKAKGQRPTYLGEEAIDNLLSMVLNLAGEVVVLRERLDTAERIIDKSGSLQKEIGEYRPSSEVIAAREAWRANFIDIVMGQLQQDHQALSEMTAETSYADVVDHVSKT